MKQMEFNEEYEAAVALERFQRLSGYAIQSFAREDLARAAFLAGFRAARHGTSAS